jgi:hypothetical protein
MTDGCDIGNGDRMVEAAIDNGGGSSPVFGVSSRDCETGDGRRASEMKEDGREMGGAGAGWVRRRL